MTAAQAASTTGPRSSIGWAAWVQLGCTSRKFKHIQMHLIFNSNINTHSYCDYNCIKSYVITVNYNIIIKAMDYQHSTIL